MGKLPLLQITKKHGVQYATILKLVHQLYGRKLECVAVYSVGNLSGLFVYPYRILQEEFDFNPSQITRIFKSMTGNGHLIKESLGSITLYRIDYSHADIVSAGIVDPYLITKGTDLHEF